jgi:hypothetical protein
MGSVISYVECPRCKSESCFVDFYYKTGEFFSSCPDCGYHRSAFYKRDDKGKLIKLDESKGLEYDNLIMVEEIHTEPYGSYRIKMIEGAGSMSGTLITQEDFDKLQQEIALLQASEESVESFVVSRYVDGVIVKETII